ncbi:Endo-1,4-beta-xylanase A [Hypsizygus marmoreus]|uniref:Endo-1,4-beta-xylanase A n=1 Tax=Hypsizygus marmoreus TaxID=39966 RepID=A0A369K0R8_HYPMA|nr:Endo-1,4-beta-xylanase A [Hypsizygus marmoreus]
MLPLRTLTILSLSLLSLVPIPALARQYKVVNRCPETVPLFIGGQLQVNLTAKGGTFTKNLPGNAGFFYTTANGGNADGSGTTRAGFFGDNDYYYIVVDPAHMNTGIAITPIQAPSNGFCGKAICETGDCKTAFQQPPTRFPPVSSTPPAVPLYACPATIDKGYLIEFCPNGAFPVEPPPPVKTVVLHPNGNTKKCVDVRGAAFANGTPVQIYDCNGTPAQKWVINRANTKVKLANTNFCLDAGSNPANAVGMKIWTCYDNLPAQAWYYTDDNRIAVTGRGLCLDLTNGVLTNSNRLQTWWCTDNNKNQVWTT